MLGVRPTWRQLIGVVGGLVCLALLFDVGVDRQMRRVDILLGASVPVCYALSNTFAKRRFHSVHPVALTGMALGATGLLMTPIGAASESVEAGGAALLWPAVALAVLGVVCTGLAYYMFFILLQKRGPLFAGMVTYLIPMGALAWGWADGEPIDPLQVAALAGVLAMTALVQSGPAPGTTPLPE